MKPEVQEIALKDIIFNQELYPRKTHNREKANQYIDVLDTIEDRGNYISIATDGTLLDGRHRQLAYEDTGTGPDRIIPVYVYPLESDKDKFAKAIELNATHGQQISNEDKKTNTLALYGKYGYAIEDIAQLVSVRKAKALEWTKTIRDDEKRIIQETVMDLWMACYTIDEIAEEAGLPRGTVDGVIKSCMEKFPGTFPYIVLHNQDKDWKIPHDDVWSFGVKTNAVTHFGNTEQRIVDNLLYLYTEPRDIVVDPFAGGGSTVDVCKLRGRRYWTSDRAPTAVRADDIRKHDVKDGPPPLAKRWQDVSLVYLDPPYWKQAEGKYSQDEDDLANMPLEQFYDMLTKTVKSHAAKMRAGSRIALIIQPTMWKAEDRHVVDHVFDLVQRVGSDGITYRQRVSCPYSTEQFLPQMVTWAKENKKLLVRNRELIIWEVQ